jgi:replication factor C large subunit
MPDSAAKQKGDNRDNQLWTVKHAPQRVDEVAGNDEARETVKKWAFDWQRGKRGKPLLIWGPTGCGKTALVRALAREMNWALTESNAGTDRGGSDFARLVGAASASDLYGSRRLLFIDEVDAVFDRVARSEGGKTLATALAPVLEEGAFPIVLAAENAWEPKLAPLRQYCSLVELRRVNWRAIAKKLLRIAEAEGHNEKIRLENAEAIARASGGDLRAAINDLQAACIAGSTAAADAASGIDGGIALGARDRQERIFETLRAIFHAKSFGEAVRASEASEADLDLLLRWIEENAPREYEDAGERAAAFDALSKAGLFEGRIRRSQNWSLLKYVRALACGGAAAARRDSKPRFVPYAFPAVIKTLGESRKNRALLASALSKIEASLHCSRKQALETTLFFSRAAGFASFCAFCGLSKEEAELLSSFD